MSLSQDTHRRGFTLLELLIVMSIITVLMAMLMPMYNIIRQNMLKSRTTHVLKKVEAGLRLFKVEWGGYPYQLSYADLAGGETFVNRLNYRIGTNISDADRTKVIADSDAAAGLFAYKANLGSNTNGTDIAEGSQPSSFTFTGNACAVPFKNIALTSSSRVALDTNNSQQKAAISALLNQCAQEQARLGMVVGNTLMRGQIICSNATTVTVNRSTQALLSSPASAGNPGFAVDYLKGDIPATMVRGEDILDAWHKPIIYISQIVPAVQGQGGKMWSVVVPSFDTRYMGMGAIGFDLTTGPGQTLINGGRPLLAYNGRVRLSKTDAGDNRGPTPTDATYFPDAANLKHSDVRYYAAPGYETEFELWSGGRDGKFSYMRDDAQNQDNVSDIDYNRGL